ncbi:hypothetical protein L915_15759, partial [Phytophthora nicotianae]
STENAGENALKEARKKGCYIKNAVPQSPTGVLPSRRAEQAAESVDIWVERMASGDEDEYAVDDDEDDSDAEASNESFSSDDEATSDEEATTE